MFEFIGDLIQAAARLGAALLDEFVEEFLGSHPDYQVTLCDIDAGEAVAYLVAQCGDDTLYHYGDAAGAWNATCRNIEDIPVERRGWFQRTVH